MALSIELSPSTPRATMPAGSYRARITRTYGKPGKVRVGAGRDVVTLHIREKGLDSRTGGDILQHRGGELLLTPDEGVSAIVQLTKLD